MIRLKVCPRCRSLKLEPVKEGALPGQAYHYAAPKHWRCIKCGFVSPILIELRNKRVYNRKITNAKHLLK